MYLFSIFSTVFTTFSTISVRTKNCFLQFSVPFYNFQYYFRSVKTRFLVPFFVCSLVPSVFAQCFPPDYFDLAATKGRQQDTHLSDICPFWGSCLPNALILLGSPLRPRTAKGWVRKAELTNDGIRAAPGAFFAESSKTGNYQFGCHTVRGLRVSLKMHDKCVSCRLSRECQKKAGRSDENAGKRQVGFSGLPVSGIPGKIEKSGDLDMMHNNNRSKQVTPERIRGRPERIRSSCRCPACAMCIKSSRLRVTGEQLLRIRDS